VVSRQLDLGADLGDEDLNLLGGKVGTMRFGKERQ